MSKNVLVTIVAFTLILLLATIVKQNQYFEKYKQQSNLLEMALTYAKKGPLSILSSLDKHPKKQIKLQVIERPLYCGIYQGLFYMFNFTKHGVLKVHFKEAGQEKINRIKIPKTPQIIGNYQMMSDRITWQFQFSGQTHYFFAPKASKKSDNFPQVLLSSKGIFSHVICDELASL